MYQRLIAFLTFAKFWFSNSDAESERINREKIIITYDCTIQLIFYGNYYINTSNVPIF